MNVKRKGTTGENELADILRRNGIRAYRNDQIFKGGQANPDVYAEIGTLPIHIEVKRVERLNVPEAMNQAIKDKADGHMPVLCHRRNREKWLVTVPLEELINHLKEGGII